MLTLLVAALGSAATGALVRAARRAPSATRARRIHRRRRLLLPAGISARVERALRGAGYELAPDDAVRSWCLAASTVVVLGIAIGPVTGLVALAGAIAAPPVALALGRARVRRSLDLAVPALVEHVAIELRSGGTVAGAIARADPGPLRIDEIHRRVALGSALGDALVSWVDLHRRGDVAAAAGALGLAAAVGGRAADALDGLSASLRARLAALAEARAQAAQARLSALVVGLAPIGFLVFTTVSDPDGARALVATPTGRACLVAGLTAQAVAGLWIHRIVTSEP